MLCCDTSGISAAKLASQEFQNIRKLSWSELQIPAAPGASEADLVLEQHGRIAPASEDKNLSASMRNEDVGHAPRMTSHSLH